MLRRLAYLLLLVSLMSIAAIGACQSSNDERQSSSNETREPIPREIAQATYEYLDQQASLEVADFVARDEDPCSLPIGGLLAEPLAPYPDLPTLINDSAAVVLGRISVGSLEPPQHGALGASLRASLAIEEVISGSAALEANPDTISIKVSALVAVSNGRMERGLVTELDPCVQGRVLLFLQESSSGDGYRVPYQGWVRLQEGTEVGATLESVAYFGLFGDYVNTDALLADVREVLKLQTDQRLPKGFLLCDHTRSADVGDAIACPGESFNPYLSFGLDDVDSGFVVDWEPGLNGNDVSRIDFDRNSSQMASLLASLDAVVLVEELEQLPASSLATLRLTGSDGSSTTLYYNADRGIIQMTNYRAQFAAPPGFELAIAPLLAP